MMKISVIVPVYNEHQQLSVLVPVLNQLSQCTYEVIVVDGGSVDGTQKTLTDAGFKPMLSDAGRAAQMNYGADIAKGDFLWFVHADTQFIDHVSKYIDAIHESKKSWGRFNVRLSGEQKIFRIIEWLINKRSAWTGIATGDQGIFVQYSLFKQIGRYDDISIMEDVSICKKLKKIILPEVISSPVLITSSRRWEHQGIFKTILRMWKMRWLYFRGVSTDKLHRLYHK